MDYNNSINKNFYNFWKNINKTLFFLIFSLFLLGLFFSLVSTSLIASDKLDTNSYYFFYRHLFYIIIAFFILITFSSIDTKSLIKLSYFLFFLSLFFLILVPIIGVEVKGSKRWIDLPFLPRFQPIEIVKPFFIILASIILSSEKNRNIYLKFLLSFLLLLPIILLLINQPDIGQTLLIFLTWFSLIFISGVNIIIFSICVMPILFGFLIPVLILIENSLNYFHLENFNQLFTIAQNSFFISFTTATIIILLSIILTVSIKYQNFKGFNFLSTIAGIGYAFPGIIIALGTLFFISFVEKYVNLSLEIFSIDLNLILIGSYFLLIFAYVSRFNAVSFGAINSGLNRLPPNLLEASRSLGNPFWYSFRKVILPLLRPSILTAFILAFVDIIKELPITLLLRPFNFETLATYVYQYANDEMLERASSAALLIVIIGLLPILFINKIMNINKKIM